MLITAGMGSPDHYLSFAAAGADELFCGYIPRKWQERFGAALPLNRREVRWVNAQIGARSELLILKSMMQDRGVPVTLTFNSPFYTPDAYPMIADIMEQCISDGFDRFIVADPVLMLHLHAQGLTRRMTLQISGETTVMNSGILPMAAEFGAKRIILHRHMRLQDMAAMTALGKGIEYEAFLLNERCRFHGGSCMSLHCDELPPMCRIPRCVTGPAADTLFRESDGTELGSSGCGLCALPELKRMGITALKLVGRGGYPECIERDIRAVRTALTLLERSTDDETYRSEMMKMLYPQGCSHHCYY